MLTAIFRLPWSGNLIFAAIFAFGAYWIHTEFQREEADKAIALAGAAPAPVTLAAYDQERDIHPAKEVHLLGWINPEFNYRLVEEKGGRAQKERFMLVLFDGNQDETARMAHAAIILPPARKDDFFDWLQGGNTLATMARDMGENGLARPVQRFNGAPDGTPDLKGLAEDAFVEAGLSRAPNFLYVEPWIDGREAALAATPEVARQAASILGTIAGVFLILAVTKLVTRNRRKTGRVSTVETAGRRPGARRQTADTTRDDPQLQRTVAAREKELANFHKRRNARPPFARTVLPSILAIAFFLGGTLFLDEVKGLPDWLGSGEALLPIFLVLLGLLFVLYRLGLLDRIIGHRPERSNPVSLESGEKLPFGQTAFGKYMGYGLAASFFLMPLLIPILLLVYGGAYLHHRFGKGGAPLKARAGSNGAVESYLASLSGSATPRRDSRSAMMTGESPWDVRIPPVEERPAPAAARPAQPVVRADARPEPKPVPKPVFPKTTVATPFSDAVRRKAKEDPFERLRKRYPTLNGKGV